MPLSPVLAMDEERELCVFGIELLRLFVRNKLLDMTHKNRMVYDSALSVPMKFTKLRE